MGRFIDLSGKKFGKLTVIKASTEKRGIHPCFECVCDCGNTFIARADKLRSGRALSCGCVHYDQIKHHKSNTYTVGGRVFTTQEFLNEYQISKTTLYRKLRNGKTIEEIAEEARNTPGVKED